MGETTIVQFFSSKAAEDGQEHRKPTHIESQIQQDPNVGAKSGRAQRPRKTSLAMHIGNGLPQSTTTRPFVCYRSSSTSFLAIQHL
jgi:hypothetical protein